MANTHLSDRCCERRAAVAGSSQPPEVHALALAMNQALGAVGKTVTLHELTDDVSLAEPLTAVLTIFVAFLGPWLWELAWFAYPLIAFVLRRMGIAQSWDR